MSDLSGDRRETAETGIPPSESGTGGARTGAGRTAPGAGPDVVEHGSLVGFMSEPVHRRLPIRRSTLLMAVAFVGFGILLYFNPPVSTTVGTGAVVHTPSGDYLVPGAVKITPTTTTPAPPATTTTPPPASSTTSIAPSATTTTTRPPAASTTTTSTTSTSNPTTTTRAVVGSTTTTSTARQQGTGPGATNTAP